VIFKPADFIDFHTVTDNLQAASPSWEHVLPTEISKEPSWVRRSTTGSPHSCRAPPAPY